MKRSRRTERMSGVLLEEISEIALRIVKDPRLRGVTFTHVDVSRDLRNARVYYSVLGTGEKQAEASHGLESAKGVIKRELGRRMALRYMPELAFVFDPSMRYAEHIEKLLKEIGSSDGSADAVCR